MTICQFSSLYLWTSMKCAYCMAIVLICLHVLLIFVTWLFIDGKCVVTLALATKAISGDTIRSCCDVLGHFRM